MNHSLESYLYRLPTRTLEMLLNDCAGDPLESYLLPLISRILQERSVKASASGSAAHKNE